MSPLRITETELSINVESINYTFRFLLNVFEQLSVFLFSSISDCKRHDYINSREAVRETEVRTLIKSIKYLELFYFSEFR